MRSEKRERLQDLAEKADVRHSERRKADWATLVGPRVGIHRAAVWMLTRRPTDGTTQTEPLFIPGDVPFGSTIRPVELVTKTLTQERP